MYIKTILLPCSFSVIQRGELGFISVSANPSLTAEQFPRDAAGHFALLGDSCTDSHVQRRVGRGFGPALICSFLSGICSDNCAEQHTPKWCGK